MSSENSSSESTAASEPLLFLGRRVRARGSSNSGVCSGVAFAGDDNFCSVQISAPDQAAQWVSARTVVLDHPRFARVEDDPKSWFGKRVRVLEETDPNLKVGFVVDAKKINHGDDDYEYAVRLLHPNSIENRTVWRLASGCKLLPVIEEKVDGAIVNPPENPRDWMSKLVQVEGDALFRQGTVVKVCMTLEENKDVTKLLVRFGSSKNVAHCWYETKDCSLLA